MARLITIPKDFAKKGDLVVLPRSEYEEYLRLKRIISSVKPTAKEKKVVKKGLREIKAGQFLTLKKLQDDLAS